jgi:HlyD family secretion protein
MKNETLLKPKRKRYFLLALVVAALSLGFGGWQIVQAAAAQSTTTASTQYQTTAVRLGSLSVSISGSGSVTASQSVDLAFSVSGKLAELNVQVGDVVKSGQVLARLDSLEALQLAVAQQQVALQSAQKTLDALQTGTTASLAQAQAEQASAQKTYAEAKANLHQKGDPRCDPSLTQDYYFQYLYAEKRVVEWEGYLEDPNTGYGHDYILQRLAPMTQERDLLYTNMKYCEGYTDAEIAASQAALQTAKANLDQATRIYETLKAHAGLDPKELETAQAALTNAHLQLTKAQTDLAGATITAPMDGTVTAVNAAVGQTVDTKAVITLSDLQNPEVQVKIDESDLSDFAVGCAAKVTFDSLTGQTFNGTVTEVSPALVSVQEVSSVQGLVELQNKKTAAGTILPPGMTASVEVTCQQADNVLIAPTQGLYEPQGQPAYVYVLNTQGQPEKREVEIGIKTVASVEIRSGLKEGEKVITSQLENQ